MLNFQLQIQKIYVAYYGRPADPLGLTFWAERLSSSNGNLDAIIDAFGNSTESNLLYAGATSAAKITAIYSQLFNRQPDPEGLAFYVEQLDLGKMTASSIALNVADGAKNDDAVFLSNKIVVANAFTEVLLSDPVAAAAYSGDTAASLARSFIFGITVSSTADVLATINAIQLGSLGSGGGGGGGGGTELVAGAVSGGIVAGPVLDGNDLQVEIFQADGTTSIGSATVSADGSYEVTLTDTNYVGAVIARVSSGGAAPDYLDEATLEEVNLVGTITAVGVLDAEGLVLYITPLTTVAASLVGVGPSGAPDGGALVADGVDAANSVVAAMFGFTSPDEMLAPPNGIRPVVDGRGSSASADPYGKVLALLSAMEDSFGSAATDLIKRDLQTVFDNVVLAGEIDFEALKQEEISAEAKVAFTVAASNENLKNLVPDLLSALEDNGVKTIPTASELLDVRNSSTNLIPLADTDFAGALGVLTGEVINPDFLDGLFEILEEAVSAPDYIPESSPVNFKSTFSKENLAAAQTPKVLGYERGSELSAPMTLAGIVEPLVISASIEPDIEQAAYPIYGQSNPQVPFSIDPLSPQDLFAEVNGLTIDGATSGGTAQVHTYVAGFPDGASPFYGGIQGVDQRAFVLLDTLSVNVGILETPYVGDADAQSTVLATAQASDSVTEIGIFEYSVSTHATDSAETWSAISASSFSENAVARVDLSSLAIDAYADGPAAATLMQQPVPWGIPWGGGQAFGLLSFAGSAGSMASVKVNENIDVTAESVQQIARAELFGITAHSAGVPYIDDIVDDIYVTPEAKISIAGDVNITASSTESDAVAFLNNLTAVTADASTYSSGSGKATIKGIDTITVSASGKRVAEAALGPSNQSTNIDSSQRGISSTSRGPDARSSIQLGNRGQDAIILSAVGEVEARSRLAPIAVYSFESGTATISLAGNIDVHASSGVCAASESEGITATAASGLVDLSLGGDVLLRSTGAIESRAHVWNIDALAYQGTAEIVLRDLTIEASQGIPQSDFESTTHYIAQAELGAIRTLVTRLYGASSESSSEITKALIRAGRIHLSSMATHGDAFSRIAYPVEARASDTNTSVAKVVIDEIDITALSKISYAEATFGFFNFDTNGQFLDSQSLVATADIGDANITVNSVNVSADSTSAEPTSDLGALAQMGEILAESLGSSLNSAEITLGNVSLDAKAENRGASAFIDGVYAVGEGARVSANSININAEQSSLIDFIEASGYSRSQTKFESDYGGMIEVNSVDLSAKATNSAYSQLELAVRPSGTINIQDLTISTNAKNTDAYSYGVFSADEGSISIKNKAIISATAANYATSVLVVNDQSGEFSYLSDFSENAGGNIYAHELSISADALSGAYVQSYISAPSALVTFDTINLVANADLDAYVDFHVTADNSSQVDLGVVNVTATNEKAFDYADPILATVIKNYLSFPVYFSTPLEGYIYSSYFNFAKNSNLNQTEVMEPPSLSARFGEFQVNDSIFLEKLNEWAESLPLLDESLFQKSLESFVVKYFIAEVQGWGYVSDPEADLLASFSRYFFELPPETAGSFETELKRFVMKSFLDEVSVNGRVTDSDVDILIHSSQVFNLYTAYFLGEQLNQVATAADRLWLELHCEKTTEFISKTYRTAYEVSLQNARIEGVTVYEGGSPLTEGSDYFLDVARDLVIFSDPPQQQVNVYVGSQLMTSTQPQGNSLYELSDNAQLDLNGKKVFVTVGDILQNSNTYTVDTENNVITFEWPPESDFTIEIYDVDTSRVIEDYISILLGQVDSSLFDAIPNVDIRIAQYFTQKGKSSIDDFREFLKINFLQESVSLPQSSFNDSNLYRWISQSMPIEEFLAFAESVDSPDQLFSFLTSAVLPNYVREYYPNDGADVTIDLGSDWSSVPGTVKLGELNVQVNNSDAVVRIDNIDAESRPVLNFVGEGMNNVDLFLFDEGVSAINLTAVSGSVGLFLAHDPSDYFIQDTILQEIPEGGMVDSYLTPSLEDILVTEVKGFKPTDRLVFGLQGEPGTFYETIDVTQEIGSRVPTNVIQLLDDFPEALSQNTFEVMLNAFDSDGYYPNSYPQVVIAQLGNASLGRYAVAYDDNGTGLTSLYVIELVGTPAT